MTIPNLITLARLALLPVVILLFRQGAGPLACGAFLLCMASDGLDGWLARRLDQRTTLGVYLDPVVDKIVILGLLYELAAGRLIGMAIPHLFLARELLQSGIRSVAASRGSVVGANWMGKTKAALQTLVLAWGLMLPWLDVRSPAAGASAMRMPFAAAAWFVLGLSWAFFGVFLFWNRRFLRD